MADDDGFSTFVHANSASLFATALLLTGDRVEAEDLLQDVWMRVFPKWNRISQSAAPLAYVRRSVVNRFLSSRRPFRPTFVPLPATLAVADPSSSILSAALLTALLSKLSARQRSAIVLRYFHGMTDMQIGQTIGCRQVTVRSLISRGLAVLRANYPGAAGDTFIDKAETIS